MIRLVPYRGFNDGFRTKSRILDDTLCYLPAQLLPFQTVSKPFQGTGAKRAWVNLEQVYYRPRLLSTKIMQHVRKGQLGETISRVCPFNRVVRQQKITLRLDPFFKGIWLVQNACCFDFLNQSIRSKGLLDIPMNF